MTNELSDDFLAGMAAARDIAYNTGKGETAAYAINRKLVALRLRRARATRAEQLQHDVTRAEFWRGEERAVDDILRELETPPKESKFDTDLQALINTRHAEIMAEVARLEADEKRKKRRIFSRLKKALLFDRSSC